MHPETISNSTLPLRSPQISVTTLLRMYVLLLTTETQEQGQYLGYDLGCVDIPNSKTWHHSVIS